MAAGNFYGWFHIKGDFDALLPSVFSFSKRRNDLKFLANAAIADSEVRDAN